MKWTTVFPPNPRVGDLMRYRGVFGHYTRSNTYVVRRVFRSSLVGDEVLVDLIALERGPLLCSGYQYRSFQTLGNCQFARPLCPKETL